MKVFINILIVLALLLIGFNISSIEFKNPLQGDSIIALIGVVACLCAILLLIILKKSKNIKSKIKD